MGCFPLPLGSVCVKLGIEIPLTRKYEHTSCGTTHHCLPHFLIGISITADLASEANGPTPTEYIQICL